jgi:hypothetical protein
VADDKDDKVIARLKQKGYIVKKQQSYIKRTFQLESELSKRLDSTHVRLKMKLRDLVNEALTQWLDRKDKEK